jgi:hypothetical protein
MISSFSTLGKIKSNTVIPPSGPSYYSASLTVPTRKMPVVIIGTGSGKTYGYSNNLTSWTWGTISPITNPTAICCGQYNSLPLWVIIGYNGTTYYSTTSTNGTTWTTPSSNISAIFKSGGWSFSVNFGLDKDGYGIFLATGYGGTSGSPNVAISSDGITWVSGGFPFVDTRFGNTCYYGNGYLVVTGNSNNIANCVMYSTNVSVADNASITWTTVGSFISQPAYGLVYSGTRWVNGIINGNVNYNSNNSPISSYNTINGLNQFPSAMMAKGNTLLVGGAGTYNNLIFNFNTAPTTTNTYIIPNNPSRTWQIEYIESTTIWIAAIAGTTSGNNSLAYITDLGRSQTDNITYPLTYVSTVNANMPVCTGVAAAR